MLTGCARIEDDESFIQIKGSDTEANMVQKISEVYMKNKLT